MQTVLRTASRSLSIVVWPDHADGGEPCDVTDLDAATALLRSFPGEENARALRTFLERQSVAGRLDRLADADVCLAVARLLVTRRARAFVEAAERLGTWGDTSEEAESPPNEAPAERVEPKTWIEILLLDMANQPIPGVRCTVTLPDGSTRETRLDTRGIARLDDLDPGTCQVTFPDLDQEAWEPA
jgi:hypothetical protein